MYLQCCSKFTNCIFQALPHSPLQAMFFLSLLLLAAPNFRVVAYPNAEYIGRPNVHYNQILSHKLLKPRDTQDSVLHQNVQSLDMDIPEQSPSPINEGSSTGWVSPGQAAGTDYTNQDENQNLVTPDLQAQGCPAGSTRSNGKLRRGLSCAIRTPVKPKQQAPSNIKAPNKPALREDITPPSPPPPPTKPLPLLIDKETGQIELDLGPEFAPPPQYHTNGPCALRKLLCCTGQLPFPFGNVENCWRCMSRELTEGKCVERSANLIV